MRAVGVFLILGFVFAVSCKDDQEKTLTLDDISHSTDKFENIDDKKEISTVKDEKPETGYFLAAFDSVYKETSWFKLDSLLFPDRFGPSNMEKWYLLNEKDSIVALHYEFKDSLRTKNAFFNWLDCYGPKCNSYQVGDQFRKQSRNSLFLVGANHLVYIESRFPIAAEKLLGLFNEKKKEQNWIYMVQIPARKKTSWSVVKEGAFLEIKKSQDI